MKSFFEKYWKNILAFSLLLMVFSLAYVAFVVVFGGVYSLLGLSYDSLGSLLLFCLMASFVSLPLEAIAAGLPLLLLSEGELTKGNAIFMTWGLDTLATALGQKVAVTLLPTVSAPDFSIMLVSILLGVLSLDFEKLDQVEQKAKF